jgi:predicted outer membrane repeat protein
MLDGFTISGGNADGPGDRLVRTSYGHGGGVHTHNSSPIVINCTITNNAAEYFGGGICSTGGGGIALTDCRFVNNTAGEEGGGLHVWACESTLKRCVFIDNHSKGHGAAIFNAGSRLRMFHCTINKNKATEGAGGIASYASHRGHGRTEVIFSRFLDNIAGCGGAISNGHECDLFLTNCSFIGNSVEGDGGAINIGNSDGVFTNCIFINNSAGHEGGAISNGGSNLIFHNCTLVRNNSHMNVGGIKSYEGFPQKEYFLTLNNSILWGNTDPNGFIEAAQIQGGVIKVNYSCIEGWTSKLGGVGNFGMNPLFVDLYGPDNEIGTEDDNLHLSPNSPCIDAGNNSAISTDEFDLDDDGDIEETIPLDVEGKSRILNGNIDIGAYESG